jgi:heme exporter protein D
VESLREFLDMGGYAVFVWPAFIVTLALMLVLAVVSRRSLRASQRSLAALEGAAKRGDAAEEDGTGEA